MCQLDSFGACVCSITYCKMPWNRLACALETSNSQARCCRHTCPRTLNLWEIDIIALTARGTRMVGLLIEVASRSHRRVDVNSCGASVVDRATPKLGQVT
jgi:hypothetical protein